MKPIIICAAVAGLLLAGCASTAFDACKDMPAMCDKTDDAKPVAKAESPPAAKTTPRVVKKVPAPVE